MSEVKEKTSSNYFSIFLTVVIVAGCVYLVGRKFDTLVRVLVTLIGFGLVVLVHEFGHFIVAKLLDIKVEAFSIGFPPMLAGFLRTENGWRIRILPKLFKKGKKEGENEEQESSEDEDGLCLTVGGAKEAGETEYQIGLIPFGGFVKMLGQEDVGKAEASDDPRSYVNKSVGVRMAVIAAGVFFNVIGAIIIFIAVFLVGIKQQPTVVGYVVPDSAAARAGLEAGDEIIEIAGKKDNLTFKDITMAAALSGRDEKVALKIKRSDGSVKEFELVAEEKDTEFGEMKLFGISPAQTLRIGKLDKAGSDYLFTKTGLKPGDVIKSVNGKSVETPRQLEQAASNITAPEVTVLVERSADDDSVEVIESRLSLSFSPAVNDVKSESDLSHIYSMVPRLFVTDILSGLWEEQEAAPVLQKGDVIVSIGDVSNPTYNEMRAITSMSEDKELPIKILRSNSNGIEQEIVVSVVPKRVPDSNQIMIGIGMALDMGRPVVAKTIGVEGLGEGLSIPRGAVITSVDGAVVGNFYELISELRKKEGRQIGIEWRTDEKTAGIVTLNVSDSRELITVRSGIAEEIPFEYLERLYKASGPLDALIMGFQATVRFIESAYVTLQRAVSGVVSPKGFMGPIGIISVSYKIVSDRPIIYYVYFLGFISTFIAVFNFLPLLPFDGGHIMFLLVEKLKGSAVSERVQGTAAYVGWVLVGSLALYVTFNDVVRSFFS